ncbi:MAG TPA: class I SAM-dependent methyltransferase [Vicinamibacterales bacterium]|jgi:SAM-dependent methyltransferase
MHTVLRKELFESDHTEDPATALALLSAACARLERLGRGTVVDGRRQYHLVVSAVHDICGALTDCEASGVAEADVRETLVPAREIFGRSPFVTRLQRWPRGYAGDFETIEWLWCGDNRAPAGTLAHAIENYALNAAIAQQHRNKVTLQAACMLQAMATSPSCRVLSIGCGSSPDLRTVINQVPSSSTFVLCDSDRDALSYSRAKLHSIADRCRFVHGMVPRVLRAVREHGPFDLILAGGLFDYLSDRFIVRTLSQCWNEILAPGGRIVFTNIARGNPFRVWIEYLADWRLIERSEEDITRICGDAGIPAPPAMLRDATSLAIVVSLAK